MFIQLVTDCLYGSVFLFDWLLTVSMTGCLFNWLMTLYGSRCLFYWLLTVSVTEGGYSTGCCVSVV